MLVNSYILPMNEKLDNQGRLLYIKISSLPYHINRMDLAMHEAKKS